MTSRIETVKIEIANSGTIQPVVRTAPPIGSLPKELIKQIFSFLNQRDLQAVASVNQTMKTSAITAANDSELSSIKNFIQSLIQNLNVETFPVEKNLLTEISQNITPQNNLLLLKGYILDVKNQLINVIKTLDTPTANNLRDQIQPPKSMEDIFKLSAIERRIDEANLIPDELESVYALRAIAQALVRAGNINRAIAVATSIPNEIVRGWALQDIAKALTQAGNINRAITVATLIPDQDTRERYLRILSNS